MGKITRAEYIDKNGKIRFCVKKGVDADRLHNRGHFGRFKDDCLMLTPLETIFLMANGKLGEVGWKKDDFSEPYDVMSKVQKGGRGPLSSYFVYEDLRKRGIYCRDRREDGKIFIDVWERGQYSESPASGTVLVNNERTSVKPGQLHPLVRRCNSLKRTFFTAIVDEESDVTYYRFSIPSMGGDQRLWNASDDGDVKVKIIGEYGIVPQKYGRLKGNFGHRRETDTTLSPLEIKYLEEKGKVNVIGEMDEASDLQEDFGIRFRTYGEMRDEGYVVKTGFKYGTHFRVYTGKPGEGHAPFLVHCLEKDEAYTWEDISQAVRVAHGVKKRMIYSIVYEEKVKYLEIKWWRM